MLNLSCIDIVHAQFRFVDNFLKVLVTNTRRKKFLSRDELIILSLKLHVSRGDFILVLNSVDIKSSLKKKN